MYLKFIKGAPESVLPACTNYLTIEGKQEINRNKHQSWQSKCDRLAREGLRILATAQKTVASSEGGTLNRCTWGHILAETARVLEMKPEDF